jgi:very-short-patch-repair endonuclease
MDSADLFRTFLGVLSTAQILQAGFSRGAMDRALAAGRVARVRRGWLAWQPDPAALAAVRAGGCVSCLSAMERLGAWQPRGTGGHVRRAEGQRDRAAVDAKGCRPYGANPPVRASIDDLQTSFRCALRCASREQLIVIADSIVYRELATLETLRSWSCSAPGRVRAWLDHVEPKAESGTESMVRLRLMALGLGVRVQQWIGSRRVDLMIGERLIIECDSAAYHADAEAFQRDRRTDRIHLAQGYLVVRLTWEQIHDEWPQIERDILAIVRRGDHRWPTRLRPA